MKRIILALTLLLSLTGCVYKEVENPFDNIDTSKDYVFKDYVRQTKGILVPINNCTYFIEVNHDTWEEYDSNEFASLEKNYFEFDPNKMTIYDGGLPFYTLDVDLKVASPIDSMIMEGISYRPGLKPGQTFLIHNNTYYLFDWPSDITTKFLNSNKRMNVNFDLTSNSSIYTDNIPHETSLGSEVITYYNLYNADFVSLS